MVNIFFPINEITFIERIMEDIEDLDDTDDWTDVFHTHIDEHVSCDSDEENILIINEYAGGIYEAIQLYKDNFGEFDFSISKHQFYALLAYISIYEKFHDTILKAIEDL